MSDLETRIVELEQKVGELTEMIASQEQVLSRLQSLTKPLESDLAIAKMVEKALGRHH